jgi:hypothetical protein
MAVGAALLVAPSAWADGFGSAGQVAVSAERLFGLVFANETEKVEGQTAERSGSSTTISLLSTPVAGLATTYSSPRIGVDVFVIQGLSIGAAIGYASVSTSSAIEDAGTTVEQDGPTLTGFIFAPRVGYAYLFADLLGIWPRAGVTYVSIGASADDPLGGHYETSANRTALTLEVPLVIAPSPNAAILVGPTLDLGIAGGDESTQESGGVTMTVKSNNKATDFGLQAGIAIAF